MGSDCRAIGLTKRGAGHNLRPVKAKLILLAAALVLGGCSFKFRGQPLVSVNPDGNFLFVHPETINRSNQTVIPHE